MGDVQRVFYFHIGTAWTALLGFILAAVFSVTYLITKDLKWDRLEVAAIEVSLVFFFITIVLGLDLGPPRLEYLVDLGPASHHRGRDRADLCGLLHAPPGHR